MHATTTAQDVRGSRLEPPPGPRPPEDHASSPLVLDRYRLLRRLGAGGFGTVWVARDERLGREVALKAVPRAPGGQGLDGRGDRARREAVAAARLNHPGVVTLYEAGADAESQYLISELVAGRTLAELINTRALSDRDAALIGLALAGALAHAHDRGVVHRDVKPHNVIVPDRPQGPAGVAKLTDFGIARLVGDEPLTRTGDVVGTLAYMAPEQAEGRRVGPEADLYALALVLYEALSGTHPVRGRGPAATARRLGAVLPSLGRTRPDLPSALIAAIDRALAPRPSDRGSLADLRRGLEDALSDLSDAGGTLDLAPRLPSLPRGSGRLAAALGGGGLMALALSVGPAPPLGTPLVAAAAVALVLVLPRAGWAVGALVALGWLAVGAGQVGTAVVVGAAAMGSPLLLARHGRLWSLPAGAPLLGLAGLAAASCALAGRGPTLVSRAAAGALGAWWLVVAEVLLGRRLLLGAPVEAASRAEWASSALAAARDGLWPLLNPGTGLLVVSWALAAALLPWFVRGRLLAVDLLGAGLWAAGMAVGTAAAGQLVSAGMEVARPHGLLAGALAAALLALAMRWLADADRLRDGPAPAPEARGG